MKRIFCSVGLKIEWSGEQIDIFVLKSFNFTNLEWATQWKWMKLETNTERLNVQKICIKNYQTFFVKRNKTHESKKREKFLKSWLQFKSLFFLRRPLYRPQNIKYLVIVFVRPAALLQSLMNLKKTLSSKMISSCMCTYEKLKKTLKIPFKFSKFCERKVFCWAFFMRRLSSQTGAKCFAEPFFMRRLSKFISSPIILRFSSCFFPPALLTFCHDDLETFKIL